MYKNRAVNQTSEQLVSIAGIAAISLALGWSDETTVDNLGPHCCCIAAWCLSTLLLHCNFARISPSSSISQMPRCLKESCAAVGICLCLCKEPIVGRICAGAVALCACQAMTHASRRLLQDTRAF